MSSYRYCSTAFLWRELACLKANRERIEEMSELCRFKFDYHARRREILRVIASRGRANRKEAA
jgi:hypothetical protein